MKVLILLAPQVGFEPTTLRLTAECSTVELLRSISPFGLALPFGRIQAKAFIIKTHFVVGSLTEDRAPLQDLFAHRRHDQLHCQQSSPIGDIEHGVHFY